VDLNIFDFKLIVENDSPLAVKGYSTFLEIGSFYNSPRVKQLGFTVFECIQTIF